MTRVKAAEIELMLDIEHDIEDIIRMDEEHNLQQNTERIIDTKETKTCRGNLLVGNTRGGSEIAALPIIKRKIMKYDENK